MEISCYKNAEFLTRIVDQHRLGYGFAPFVGSGLSAPSGILILMGMEFTEYLAYTVYRVVGPEKDGLRWNLREHGWPKYPSQEEVNHTIDWFKSQYRHICKRFALVPEFDGQDKVKGFSRSQESNDLYSPFDCVPMPRRRS